MEGARAIVATAWSKAATKDRAHKRRQQDCLVDPVAAVPGTLYIAPMPKTVGLPTWRISRVKGNMAEQLGVVSAADTEAAIKLAAKELNITDAREQQRLAARPDA